ncbi:hypothetical protein E2542_SST05819 [Spatholobus suberectus]|nr:hypothetical protein E2542_SST05819 [Spatholobus suberectus]
MFRKGIIDCEDAVVKLGIIYGGRGLFPLNESDEARSFVFITFLVREDAATNMDDTDEFTTVSSLSITPSLNASRVASRAALLNQILQQMLILALSGDSRKRRCNTSKQRIEL